ncbi:helix-turn-helix domain-containing protein [Roseateles sp. GG27B]
MATKSKISSPFPIALETCLIDFGRRVVLARKARGLTQHDLAHLADVGLSTVASLEGGYPGVSLGTLLRVLKALNLHSQVDKLLQPSDDPALVEFALRKLRVN